MLEAKNIPIAIFTLSTSEFHIQWAYSKQLITQLCYDSVCYYRYVPTCGRERRSRATRNPTSKTHFSPIKKYPLVFLIFVNEIDFVSFTCVDSNNRDSHRNLQKDGESARDIATLLFWGYKAKLPQKTRRAETVRRGDRKHLPYMKKSLMAHFCAEIAGRLEEVYIKYVGIW